MVKISLTQQNEVTLKTTLTGGQVSKFNVLLDKLIIHNGTAYVPLDELHGVLLTNSRQRAKNIINAHRDVVKQFLIDTADVPTAIVPIGLYLLLEKLAVDNPKRALDYRASLTLLAYIIGSNTQLAFNAQQLAVKKQQTKDAVIAKLKKLHRFCQLSKEAFGKEAEKHAHHIIGESERPEFAADENNIIIIQESIHDDYHDWLNSQGLEISKATLRNFARKHNYNTNWSHSSIRKSS